MSDERNFGSWAVAESPITIEYSLVVIEEIRQVVAEGFQRLSRGGLEVGGVLYGRHDGRTIQIQAMREIACEHARGPSFLLSEKDRAALGDQMARAQEDPRLEGMTAVGWFLSHTRGEIALIEPDLEVFDAFFPAPWQVTLVIRPARGSFMRAGFFVRESNGAVKSERSYLDFTFPDRPAMPERPPRDRGLPGDRGLQGDRAIPADRAVPGDRAIPTDRRSAPYPDAPVDTMPSFPRDLPLFGTAASMSSYLPQSEPRRKWPWGMVAVVLAAAVLAVLGLRLITPRLTADPLSLSVSERDGQLQIQWNHSARSVTGATRGMLEITDGQESRTIPLSTLDLTRGSFNYLRKSADVEIRMTVEDATGEKMQEASRFLGSPPAVADPNELDATRVERDSLQDEIARLRAQNQKQAERIQQLERTLVILQTRLGITPDKR
jgi:proteasome lid subunit RPN8/RPN11